MGDAERRAFFLLDMMIGDLGGDNGSREGVARLDLEGVPKLTVNLEGVPRLTVVLEGVPRLTVGSEGVPRQMVDLEGVPSSLRGVATRLAVGL